MIPNHEWRLVAPWYHWQRQLDGEGRKPWQTKPVFQKFDQTEFVKTFTQDPQLSLKFFDSEDTVFDTSLKDVDSLVTGPLVPPPRFTQLYAPKQNGGTPAKAQEATLVPTGTRKLYLATHKRNYLVVSELHCYAPGFPKVTPDQVCQAGFVVRRRSLIIPAKQKEAHQAADQIVKEINSVKSDLAYWQQTTPAIGFRAKRRAQAVQKAIADGSYQGKLTSLSTQLNAAQQKLVDWRTQYNVSATLEGWIPGPFENIGSWESVEDTPQQTKAAPFPNKEATFPAFALFPDPNIPNHSAKGRLIYFGVVPTSSLDTDQFGVPRFDSDATYEIRCFVRRHKTDCPRLDKTPDCHGEIVWSEPTEIYKLASATDLIGTSNRPITIKLPDFKELAAQAAALPASKLAPVRMVQPQSMNFKVDDGKATGGGVGGFQICFFSIPLITIVAMFLLQLFLPIVVFLFGLFFLLSLKFCIPPSLTAAAGLSAKLDVLMPKLELDASLDVDVAFPAALKLEVGFDAPDLNAVLQKGITDEHGITKPADMASLNDFSNAALLPVGVGINDAKKLTDEEGKPKPEVGLDLTGSLELEPRLEVKIK